MPKFKPYDYNKAQWSAYCVGSQTNAVAAVLSLTSRFNMKMRQPLTSIIMTIIRRWSNAKPAPAQQ